MSFETQVRMTSYASLAAVASTGLVAEARADLMIFDVGTTLTLQPVQGFGGPFVDSSTFDYGLELTGLGQTMNFFGIRFAGSNPTNSASFFRGSGWSVNFDSASGGIAKSGKVARTFSAGQSVGSMNKFNDYVPGGYNKSKNIASKGTFSIDKGALDGQAYIGFLVPAQGFGIGDVTYGWVDLTVGEDEA